jgi:hypothetical protein
MKTYKIPMGIDPLNPRAIQLVELDLVVEIRRQVGETYEFMYRLHPEKNIDLQQIVSILNISGEVKYPDLIVCK